MTYALLADRLLVFSRNLSATADEFEALDTPALAELKACAERLAGMALTVSQSRRLDALPPGQARVLAFVREYIARHSVAPTRLEIADGLGFSSPNGAHTHLKRLEKRGVLTLIEGAARGIRLNRRGISAQIAGGQA